MLTIIKPLVLFKQWWWKQKTTFQLGELKPSMPRFHLPLADLPDFVQQCPVAMRYYHGFQAIDWELFPERDLQRQYPQTPIPYATFAAAMLIKIDQNRRYMSDLRDYLLDHPALIWLLGFPLHLSATALYGFDADASLPTQRHLTQMLRKIPNDCFQFLLDESVCLLRDELQSVAPDFGQAISLDTKHILAWVKENNPKAYVPNRFDKNQQPAGDPDCKLGCKRRHNQHGSLEDAVSTPTSNPQPASQVEVAEYYWGYASGVVATKVPTWGEFVLAELTQPFDRSDVSYFQPLLDTTEKRLGFKPHFGAFDAAFDAFYVFEYFHQTDADWTQGFAAIPFSQRNPKHKLFNEDGHPLCDADLPMRLQYTFTCRTTLVEHQRAHYVCPFKGVTDALCPIQHARWNKGGCTHRIPTSIGARLRHQIDRDSELYKTIYQQRTATERINS